jgi:hypothetical protein
MKGSLKRYNVDYGVQLVPFDETASISVFMIAPVSCFTVIL